jgi:hypothetical protein
MSLAWLRMSPAGKVMIVEVPEGRRLRIKGQLESSSIRCMIPVPNTMARSTTQVEGSSQGDELQRRGQGLMTRTKNSSCDDEGCL